MGTSESINNNYFSTIIIESMNDKKSQEVTVEEALRMEIIINQALIDLLVEKAIIMEEELLEKVNVLKKEIASQHPVQ